VSSTRRKTKYVAERLKISRRAAYRMTKMPPGHVDAASVGSDATAQPEYTPWHDALADWLIDEAIKRCKQKPE